MPRHRLLLLLGLLALSCAAYLTLNVRANWAFTLELRAPKLIALLCVGAAVSTATVLFQAITHNRILTPSIMGFDALYVLLVSGAVYLIGGIGLAAITPIWIFAISTGLLISLSLALFSSLVLSKRQDLMRMILTGVIFSLLFRSLNGFLQRMIDPNEYMVVQVASYARFNQIEADLLLLAVPMLGVALLLSWRIRFRLDVLMLGHDSAINLGETPRIAYLQVLCLIAVLVSVSTALVGPVAFLGLLTVTIAQILLPSPDHRIILPAAAMVTMITLVAGQALLEHAFRLSTPLSVVIDLLGGCVFIALLMRSLRK